MNTVVSSDTTTNEQGPTIAAIPEKENEKKVSLLENRMKGFATSFKSKALASRNASSDKSKQMFAGMHFKFKAMQTQQSDNDAKADGDKSKQLLTGMKEKMSSMKLVFPSHYDLNQSTDTSGQEGEGRKEADPIDKTKVFFSDIKLKMKNATDDLKLKVQNASVDKNLENVPTEEEKEAEKQGALEKIKQEMKEMANNIKFHFPSDYDPKPQTQKEGEEEEGQAKDGSAPEGATHRALDKPKQMITDMNGLSKQIFNDMKEDIEAMNSKMKAFVASKKEERQNVQADGEQVSPLDKAKQSLTEMKEKAASLKLSKQSAIVPNSDDPAFTIESDGEHNETKSKSRFSNPMKSAYASFKGDIPKFSSFNSSNSKSSASSKISGLSSKFSSFRASATSASMPVEKSATEKGQSDAVEEVDFLPVQAEGPSSSPLFPKKKLSCEEEHWEDDAAFVNAAPAIDNDDDDSV
jgi:hypothetical protein